MRRSIVVLLAIALPLSLYGQRKEQGYGNFDFETGFGVPFPTTKIAGDKNKGGFSIYFEGRWQLNLLPVDIGFHTGISRSQRYYLGYKGSIDNYDAIPVLVISDWQFGRGKRFNPYAGLGVGISMNDDLDGWVYTTYDFAIYPRIGIRCFKFLNISAGWLVTKKNYSRLNVNLGFYF